MSRPLIHYYTDGGVWKVKWHPKPEKKNYIAAACMYNGFHIYDVNLESGKKKIYIYIYMIILIFIIKLITIQSN